MSHVVINPPHKDALRRHKVRAEEVKRKLNLFWPCREEGVTRDMAAPITEQRLNFLCMGYFHPFLCIKPFHND